ncbi:acyl-CoA-like ligand-binding transcription factor [Nocardia mexicana]|uniref:TetR family transcriptional regulator n=1 Tax=Nocardia mexicana TaxID=279262 RepID=A0A370GS92_9NOCA|nr:TetR family transcriptional regulator [Nocardia mexicana]RDI45374.1 TetR family transcriptional regulator [Nocardia mexicana]
MGRDDSSPRTTGLRARKAERTRNEIQRHALRLFREQGYHQTTVEQVAAAAEVATSTAFRYFPRKEDLARLGEFQSLGDALADAFVRQPPEASTLTALRSALATAFAALDPTDRADRRERDLGLLEVPELWAANVPVVVDAMATIADLVADRTGRARDDPAVRGLAGAVLGIGLEVLQRAGREPDLDIAAEFDRALASLEDAVTM